MPLAPHFRRRARPGSIHIERVLDWAKALAGLREMRHRGLPKVGWQFALSMADKLVRLPTLLIEPAP